VGATLFNPDPAAYLPHRKPFLMLDRILELEPGVRARAEKLVTGVMNHLPQMLLIESIAQLAGIAASNQEGVEGFLASIGRAEFSAVPAIAGDRLIVTARILKSFGRLCLVEGDVECNGNRLVEAQMSLGIGAI
jgi:3-hydroxyacyl-[acyl-carrier-protein] dehydratase